MNAPYPLPPRRRRRWPWVLALVLTPLFVVAIAAASYLTLSRDAVLLRQEVMAATEAKWQTKVQLSAGRLTLWVAGQFLRLVPEANRAQTRAALAAVNSVNVGVYQRSSTPATWSRDRLLNATDRTMRDRGWSRVVGVADREENVLIYMPADFSGDGRICLAVVKAHELVVVSVTLDPAALAELLALSVEKHLPHSLGAVKI